MYTLYRRYEQIQNIGNKQKDTNYTQLYKLYTTIQTIPKDTNYTDEEGGMVAHEGESKKRSSTSTGARCVRTQKCLYSFCLFLFSLYAFVYFWIFCVCLYILYMFAYACIFLYFSIFLYF